VGALKPRLRVEYSAVTHLSSNSLATLISSINLDGLVMLKPTIVPANWKFFMAITQPPINGSAHTWHHSLKVLLGNINTGGKPLGGSMPAFQNLLTVDEQRWVIAAFQDYWPDDTYAQWRVIDRR